MHLHLAQSVYIFISFINKLINILFVALAAQCLMYQMLQVSIVTRT